MPMLSFKRSNTGPGRTIDALAGGAASLLAGAVLLALGVASLFVVAVFNAETFDETAAITARSPALALLGALALAGVLAAGVYLLLRRGTDAARRRRAGLLALGAAVVVAVLSIAWACSMHRQPNDDQLFVWQMGQCLADNTPEKLDTDYIQTYPQQCGMALFFELFIRLFGANPVPAFGIFSGVCAGLCVLALCAICRQLSDSPAAVALCALLCLLFAPLGLYSPFVYGTLISPTFSFWGLYGVLRLCKGGDAHNGRSWLLALLLPLSAAAYNGALIFGIAAFLALLFSGIAGGRQGLLRLALPGVLLLALCAGAEPGAQAIFCARTGTPAYEGMPKTAWIAMGIHADDENTVAGPGSYNGTNRSLFWDNKADAAATDAAAWENIRQYLNGYKQDHARFVSFFSTKTAYQWLDPWFGALTMNYNPATDSPGPFAALLCDGEGLVFRALRAVLTVLLGVIYLGAAGGTAVLAVRRRGSVWAQLCGITFLGSFIFQLVWESKSRYCFPYALLLLPLAAVGLSVLVEKLPKKQAR